MQISAAGSTTHYQHLGSQGPVLVLLHGWGCTWEIFAPIIGELTRKQQLIIPDLPGFGGSTLPTTKSEAWSSQEYLVWLQAFLDQVVKNEPYSIGGHSFGGKLSALWASTHPKNLKGLILTDASGLPDALTPREFVSYTLSGFTPSFIKRMIPQSLKNKLLKTADIATDYQAASPELQAVLRKIVRENIQTELSQITVPTLVCWGEHDQTTPIHQGEMMAQLIPNSKLVRFEKSQHYPFIDESSKFIGEVNSFLTQL
jgi:pimeloyl-ACP methyl ester carboxylesterase